MADIMNNKSIFRLISTLSDETDHIFVVGGFIRDMIMGRSTKDIDFAVAKNPQKIARSCASALKAPCIILDDENHVYRVIHPKTKQYLDFALMQGDSILEDLTRRDFTINALASPLTETLSNHIFDPYDGIHDIKNKKIRLITQTAFSNDPIRLIRAFRFSAELNFSIDPSTLKRIQKDASLIMQSAGERIREELLKICACPDTGSILEHMASAKLLYVLFPELKRCRNIAKVYYPNGGVFRHCIDTVKQMDYITQESPALFNKLDMHITDYVYGSLGGFSRSAFLKLAALFHDIGKPATAKKIKGRLRFFLHEDAAAEMVNVIGARLRLSRKEIQFIKTIARAHMRPGNLAYVEEITNRAIHRFFRDYGDTGVGILLVSLADRFCYISKRIIHKKSDKHHKTILKLLKRYFLKKESVLPPVIIDGHTLMKELNIPEGPLVGRILKTIRESQVRGRIKTKKQALQVAKKQLNSMTSIENR